MVTDLELLHQVIHQENTVLTKSKIINNCAGTITLNTEGEYNNPINLTSFSDDFLKKFKQMLSLKNTDIFKREPITIDVIQHILNQVTDHQIKELNINPNEVSNISYDPKKDNIKVKNVTKSFCKNIKKRKTNK